MIWENGTNQPLSSAASSTSGRLTTRMNPWLPQGELVRAALCSTALCAGALGAGACHDGPAQGPAPTPNHPLHCYRRKGFSVLLCF